MYWNETIYCKLGGLHATFFGSSSTLTLHHRDHCWSGESQRRARHAEQRLAGQAILAHHSPMPRRSTSIVKMGDANVVLRFKSSSTLHATMDIETSQLQTENSDARS